MKPLAEMTPEELYQFLIVNNAAAIVLSNKERSETGISAIIALKGETLLRIALDEETPQAVKSPEIAS